MALGGGCEILLHCDGGAGARRDLHGPRRGRRRRDPGLGRLHRDDSSRWFSEQEAPGRTDAAGRQGVRDDLDGQGLDLGRGGARAALPARERRRDDEPRPPARRRQGEGARDGRRGLRAARSRSSSSLPGPSGPGGPRRWRSHGFRASGAATPHDDVVSGRLATVVTGGDTDVDADRSPRTRCRASSARRSSPWSRRRHAGADRAHARDRQAAPQLSRPTRDLRGPTAMATYKAPLRDLRFAYYELFDGASLTAAPRLRGGDAGPAALGGRGDRQDRERGAAAAERGRRPRGLHARPNGKVKHAAPASPPRGSCCARAAGWG